MHRLDPGDDMNFSGRIKRAAVCLCAAFISSIIWSLAYSASAQEIHINLFEEQPNPSSFHIEVIAVHAAEERKFKVYIYHTHTYEAYDTRDGNEYKETEKWRTADSNYSVVRLGSELKKALENAGIEVMHDLSDYEMPKLSSAYSRSLKGLEEAAKVGYDLYIDLHRDSYSENNGPNTIEKKGENLGRFLFLIGKGTGTGFDEKPDWEANAKVAQIISDALNDQATGLSRGIKYKSGRYNQHAAVPCVLIEAGNNQNTLSEMLPTIPCLANAICVYLDTLK